MAKTKFPIDVSDLSGLTPQVLNFIGEYCSNNFDEISAYKKVFAYKAKGLSLPEIRMECFSLLNDREVKIAVQRFVDGVISPHKDRMEIFLFNFLKQRMSWVPTDFFNDDGSPKKFSQISQEKLICVDQVMNDLKGARASEGLLNYKLCDKDKAASEMMKFLNKADEITAAKPEVTDDSRARIADIMAGAMAGMKAEQQRKENSERKAEQAQTIKAEVVTEPLQLDKPDPSLAIHTDPVVKKAREIASKKTSGIAIDDNELVKQAIKVRQAKLGK